MHVLSEKNSLASDDWILFSRPLLLLVKREENASISLVDKWKSQFLDQEQDEYNISCRVERACVHGKQYMGGWVYGTQSRQNERIGVSKTRHERAQHISVITRQPGLIREVHQLVPENSPKSFEGRRLGVVTWCPGFAYQHFDGCQADDAQAKWSVQQERVHLASRKLMIILWKGIKIELVATGHRFPEQERSAASTAARRQLGDSGSGKKKPTLRGYIIQVYSQTEEIEHQNIGISGRLPLGTGRWSTEDGSSAIEQ